MHPDSRLGWSDLLCHDVVSPLGVLFWGREREPLTLAWFHTVANSFHPTLGLFLGKQCQQPQWSSLAALTGFVPAWALWIKWPWEQCSNCSPLCPLSEVHAEKPPRTSQYMLH